jgi:hypothetical protein
MALQKIMQFKNRKGKDTGFQGNYHKMLSDGYMNHDNGYMHIIMLHFKDQSARLDQTKGEFSQTKYRLPKVAATYDQDRNVLTPEVLWTNQDMTDAVAQGKTQMELAYEALKSQVDWYADAQDVMG